MGKIKQFIKKQNSIVLIGVIIISILNWFIFDPIPWIDEIVGTYASFISLMELNRRK